MSVADVLAPTVPPAAQATASRGLMSGAAAAFAALLGPAQTGQAAPGPGGATGPRPIATPDAMPVAALAEVETNVETGAPLDGQAQLLSGAAMFTPAAPPAQPTAVPATAKGAATPPVTPAPTPTTGAAPAAAMLPGADPTAAPVSDGEGAKPATPTPASSTATPVAAAAQAVNAATAASGTAGVSAALAFGEAVAQVRQQSQALEGDRRVERQDRQKAPAATPVSTAPTATTTPPAAGATAAAPQPTALAATLGAESGVPVVEPATPTTASADAPTAEPLPTEASAPAATPASKDAPALGLARATIETTAMLAAQIIRRLDQRSTRFEMALTPEGLGRVDVAMEIDSDGRLAARLAFDNPVASLELRARADELRRQLEAAGFTLADDALDFANRDGGASGQAFDRGARGNRFNRAFAGAAALSEQADAAVGERIQLSLAPSGVDMKV